MSAACMDAVLSGEAVEAPKSVMTKVLEGLITGSTGSSTAFHPSGVRCSFCSVAVSLENAESADVSRRVRDMSFLKYFIYVCKYFLLALTLL